MDPLSEILPSDYWRKVLVSRSESSSKAIHKWSDVLSDYVHSERNGYIDHDARRPLAVARYRGSGSNGEAIALFATFGTARLALVRMHSVRWRIIPSCTKSDAFSVDLTVVNVEARHDS